MHEPRAPAVLHLEALRDVGHGLVARVVPEHQMVRTGAASEAVPEIRGARETAAPRATVLADLMQRLDDEGILSDALGDGRKLAGLNELRELRRLLEHIGRIRGIGHDFGAFELS